MFALSSFSMTRRRIPTWLRIIAVMGALLVVATLLWATMVAATYGAAWLRLGPDLLTPSATVAVGTQEPRTPEGTHTLLIVVGGSDATLQAPPAIVQYGGPRTRPVVVTIPRELTVAAVDDDRITIGDVYADTGVVGLRQTVIDFTEVAIDDVVVVTPRNLAKLIDLIGEFTHCDPACVLVDGAGFLAAYGVRDDNARLEYLGAVLGSVADTIDRNWVMRHPRRAWRIVAAVPDAVETTVSLRGGTLLRTFAAIREVDDTQWVSTPLLRAPDGTVLAAPEPSMLQFAALREGTVFSDSATVTVEELLQELRDEVAVAVANAAGIQGLAAKVTEQLQQFGYQIVASGNASRFDAQQTEVQFRADDPRAVYIAEEIAEHLGDVVLRPQTDTVMFERESVDVLVLLGAKAAA
ncbi:MAG: LCP family protein [Nitriliruptoraceae bacterium]